MAIETRAQRVQDELELIANAMADPLRSKILGRVAEVAFAAPRGGGSLERHGVTARRLAELLHETPRRVRYHLDVLCEQGLLEVQARRQRRGVVERLFIPRRPLILDEREVATLSAADQKKILLRCLSLIFADLEASIQTGAAVRSPSWAAVRVAGEVDEQGRGELAKLHADFIGAAQEAIARAGARIERSGETPVPVVSANLFFEAASWLDGAGGVTADDA